MSSITSAGSASTGPKARRSSANRSASPTAAATTSTSSSPCERRPRRRADLTFRSSSSSRRPPLQGQGPLGAERAPRAQGWGNRSSRIFRSSLHPFRPAVPLARILAALAGACATTPPARRDVVVGLVGEPRTVFDDDPSARFVAAAVTETLVRRDEHDELVSRLAESVPTIENGGVRVVTDDAAASDGRLVATFRLREARWQDGQPITAPDVRFAGERDELAPAGTMVRWMADRVGSVEVLSARDFRVLYRNGERWDDSALAPRVLPSHRLAQATAAQRAAYAREPVHAGPFAIAAWLPGSITLSAFKDYVLGPPKLGRLEIHFFSTRAAALQALLKGDIDVAPWPVLEADLAKTLDRFADGTRLLAHYVPTEAMTVLRFGSDPNRFGDPVVRKAIELAVDRQSIVDDVFVGRARVPQTFLLPPHAAATEGAGAGAAPHRARARSVLVDAGFVKGQFRVLQRAGERMTVTPQGPPGSTPPVQGARRGARGLPGGRCPRDASRG